MYDEKIYANGICAEIDKKTIHLWRWHHGELTQLPDSSFSEEIITVLRYRSDYEFEKKKAILKFAESADFQNPDMLTEEQLQICVDIALDTAEILTDENTIIGELLYADIMNRIKLTYYETIFSHEDTLLEILNALELSSDFSHILFQLIGKTFEYDDLQDWLQECVMKSSSLLCRRQYFEFIPREKKLVQRYVFTNFADYYAFIFLHFAKECKKVQVCQFCGNVFVPKTKRITRYCDKVNPFYGKPCRNVAPKEQMSAKIFSCAVLDEYNRAKNRNYKRVERLALKNNTTPSDEILARQRYETWYQKASSARKQYLAKEISEQEFQQIIHEID